MASAVRTCRRFLGIFDAPADEALKLQGPLPNDALKIVATGEKKMRNRQTVMKCG